MNAILFEHILVIEDNGSHAMLVKRAIRPFVGTVQHASSLAEALVAMKDQRPDLVLTDLYLPDASRSELIEAVCQAVPHVPVLVLTSSSSLDDAVAAMKVGARDFIVKTFDDPFKESLSFSLKRIYDLTELEREQARLQRELALLQLAIQSSEDALGVIDASGAVRYSNHSFEAVVGCTGSFFDLLRSRFAEGDQAASDAQSKINALKNGAVWQTELRTREEKPQFYDMSIAATPEQEQQAWVVWLRNVTEQRRRERFQREMLSTTTHDLKGPLGAILLSTEMLTEALPADSRERQLSVRIASAAQGALDLIEEFLSARRIQEGNFVLKPTPQDIGELMQEVVEAHRNMAEARAITLTVEQPRLTQSPLVDRTGFIRVLGNLVNNALKYTPKGGRVEVRAFERSGLVHVQVKDSGTGIEPADVRRIFERFSRLDKHRDVAGSGLGLFVVKSVVGAHGGTVELTSKVGEGSTFEVAFPFQPPVNERGELIVLDFE